MQNCSLETYDEALLRNRVSIMQDTIEEQQAEIVQLKTYLKELFHKESEKIFSSAPVKKESDKK